MIRRLTALSAIVLAGALTFAADSYATSYPVTVTLAGSGGGTVVGGGGAINCPGDCSEANYSSGAPLSLTATPDAYSTFGGWTGACAPAGTYPICNLTVTGNTDIGATFDVVPTGPISVSSPQKAKCKKKKKGKKSAAAAKKCKKHKKKKR